MAEEVTPGADSGAGRGTTAVVAALLANLGIAVAKFVGFLISGASSMLAEAFHSVADTGNQAMLLFGSRLARREADHQHLASAMHGLAVSHHDMLPSSWGGGCATSATSASARRPSWHGTSGTPPCDGWRPRSSSSRSRTRSKPGFR